MEAWAICASSGRRMIVPNITAEMPSFLILRWWTLLILHFWIFSTIFIRWSDRRCARTSVLPHTAGLYKIGATSSFFLQMILCLPATRANSLNRTGDLWISPLLYQLSYIGCKNSRRRSARVRVCTGSWGLSTPLPRTGSGLCFLGSWLLYLLPDTRIWNHAKIAWNRLEWTRTIIGGFGDRSSAFELPTHETDKQQRY